MKWIHIDFWFWDRTFRTDRYLTDIEQSEFNNLLAKFISKCQPYINRKFFLYEDIPHCFLALEVKDIKDIPKIVSLTKILKADFIYKAQYNALVGGDEGNGEGFLNVLNAMTDFYLFHKDQRITHIIHCCMEFMLQSRQSECEFYRNMSILYQVVKIKNKKVVYGVKRFSPSLRKKLISYIDKLDLRKK